MELKGKVIEVSPLQQVSETFKKRDLIIEYAENPTYPEYLRFEALQDKTALLDEARAGDIVTVSFNLRGRPWTDAKGVTSYFNSLVIWRLNFDRTTAAPAQGQQRQASQSASPTDYVNNPPDIDDLPF